MKKDFTYTLKDKETGKIMYQEVTTFGSKEKPFPEDWIEDSMIQIALQDHKEVILNKLFEIDIEEGNKLTLDKKKDLSELEEEDVKWYCEYKRYFREHEDNYEDIVKEIILASSCGYLEYYVADYLREKGYKLKN